MDTVSLYSENFKSCFIRGADKYNSWGVCECGYHLDATTMTMGRHGASFEET